MPGLSGPALVREARRRWPTLRVLYVSGHTGDDTPEGFLQHGDRLLGKPFSAQAIVEAVGDLLLTEGAGADEAADTPGDRHLQAVPPSV